VCGITHNTPCGLAGSSPLAAPGTKTADRDNNKAASKRLFVRIESSKKRRTFE
jgi:hypothetical protein